MEVRELRRDEVAPAMALVWQVFSEFEAPEYAPEGVKTFRAFIRPEAIAKRLDAGEMRIYGAFLDGGLRGALAGSGAGHINLLFVQKDFHRQGIGSALFAHYADICRNAKLPRITVNSSPFAVEVYRRLEFTDMDKEQLRDGIRYTPMECKL